MFFYIIVGTVMAVGFIGMIVCAKKQADIPIAKPASFLLLGLVLFCAILILVKSMGSGETKQLIANEMYYARASAEILGRQLSTARPGAVALVVVEDKKSTSDHMKQRIDALKAGLGSTITVAAIDSPDLLLPEPGKEPIGDLGGGAAALPAATLPPEDMMMMMPVQEMMRAYHFDDLLAKNPGCNLIISFIGLPRDVAEMQIWGMDPELQPKLALLQGEVHSLKNAILSEAIVAAIAYRPDAKFDEDAPPKDIQAAFDKRYLLITPQNVEEIEAKYKMFAE
jgi:hypothetical protein